MEEHTYVEYKRNQNRLTFPVMLVLFLSTVVFILIFYFSSLNNPPNNFPINTVIEIPEGSSGKSALMILEDAHIIRSHYFARLKLNEIAQERTIKAGSYIFDEPVTTVSVLASLLDGSSMTQSLVLTLPEGFHARDIAMYIPEGYEGNIEVEKFLPYEGYLFPDTYFISPDMSTDDIFNLLRNTYKEKLSFYTTKIESSLFTEEEVITLASILEREANTEESMRVVSGILQDRLEIGMALQVDATFDYILGKESSELTEEDLEIDSPYNTYTNRGLPPTPISNPGLMAIDAVLNPTKTDYLYYLTGKDGEFYYATTFDEHKRNKELYLR